MDTPKEHDSPLVRRALELLGVPKAPQLPPMQNPAETKAVLCNSKLAIEPGEAAPSAENINHLKLGSTITWDSPLFGLLSGELLEVREDGWAEVFNPVTETVTPIPPAWVRQAR